MRTTHRPGHEHVPAMLRITSTGECRESDRLVVALADATLHS
ncbi:hypothetical protein [Streptomyces sp. NPDC095613]